MEIIVTHDMADFDALSAAVAAQKLHPGASIVLGRRIGREVRAFLALHKDRFPTCLQADVDAARVEHFIAVDVRRKDRLVDYAPILARAERGEVSVTVYDHHPASDQDIRADHELVAPVGSATTLLVECLTEKQIPIDEQEATLFALGIHADTGSLTYASTTARDANALARSLECGASLVVLARYLTPGFSAPQRRVLARALDAVEIERVGPVEIAWLVLELEHAVDGLSEVTSELLALGGHAALFALFAVGHRRVQVVARSRSPLVDVGRVVGEIGGGGHPQAASASVKGGDAAKLASALRAIVHRSPPAVRRVAEVMSSPVHTVSPETSLRSVARSLAAWQASGAPVVAQGRLVGIVSGRDLRRAERDGRLDLPVSSSMTHEVRTVDVDTSPEQALELMQGFDVGRLPVMRAGRVVGIVTRSDLLKRLYHGSP